MLILAAPVTTAPERGQSGVSLIEVLIALAVLSIGLLGVAGLQSAAKQSNYDAVQRTSASQLAYDYLERVRANSAALADYLPAAPLGGATQGAEPAPNCLSLATTCTPAELAAHDLWEWERQLDGALEVRGQQPTGGLVEPTACIVGPAGAGPGLYSIAIAWRGLNALSNPTASDCGQGTGKYGDNDEFRRVVIVQTFISEF